MAQYNVLIDTNILIPLEDTSRELDPRLAEMRRLVASSGHRLWIHPVQREDIERDKDEGRKAIVLSRLNQHEIIPNAPSLSAGELDQYGWRQQNDNDRIDNLLLHALCRGAVHFLVSDDKGVHKKARLARVHEQVHFLDQFLAFLKSEAGEFTYKPLGLRTGFLYEFDVSQPFFDSLRSGYNGFDAWYHRAAADRRQAWYLGDAGDIQAMCIYKHEKSPCVTSGNRTLAGDALKLCTLKVGQAVRGRKLGERLLSAAFEHAAKRGIPYIYLHTFDNEQEFLVSLCESFGFQNIGKYGRDDVFLKEMSPPPPSDAPVNPLEYAVRYYPHYLDGLEVEKYVIPIRKQYHEALFANTSQVRGSLFEDDPASYSPLSTTIKKAYLSHSRIKNIEPGSIVLFYRTGDRRSIECLGVVEQSRRGKDAEDIMPLISKRTVFSRDEVSKWLEKETLVILFRLMRTLDPIRRDVLETAGIRMPIQSIRSITHGQYIQIVSAGV